MADTASSPAFHHLHEELGRPGDETRTMAMAAYPICEHGFEVWGITFENSNAGGQNGHEPACRGKIKSNKITKKYA